MRFRAGPLKLVDAAAHGAGAELFVVEGDAAADTVAQVRDARTQAVLPMQGKPLNTVRASAAKVAGNPLFAALLEALGAGPLDAFDPAAVRFERVLLLMDPDADGIHCGALMQMFFHRWMRPLVDAGRIWMVRPPVGELRAQGAVTRYAHTEGEFRALCQAHAQDPAATATATATIVRYRGLANIDPRVLAAACLDPSTRFAQVVRASDVEMAMRLFGSL